MENPFADLIPGAKKARAPTAVQNRRLEMGATGESIESANVNQAQGRTALAVDSAVVSSDIDKRRADAERAKTEAERAKIEIEAARLKARYPEMTDAQRTAAARAVVMQRGEALYQKALKQGYKPEALGNKVTDALSNLPWNIGDPAADFLRDPKAEMAVQGERLFTEGALRTMTGAAGPKEERPQTKMQYFPNPWQSGSPDLRRDLEALRKEQIETARRAAGPALSVTPRAAAAPKALPAGLTPAGARAQAKAAIAAGKPRAAVLQRLRDLGVDTTGL